MPPEIADVAVFPVREPVSRRTYTIVRVRTTSGLSGFGECRQVSMDQLATTRKFWLGRPATSRVTMQLETPLDAAMDMALLDIVGKTSKAPVYRLLGGPTRNKVRAMASVDANEVALAWAAGYRAVSVRLPMPVARNQGQAYQLQVRKLAESLRAGGGDFVLDADASLTPGDAGSVAATLQPLHPLWLDEPCAIANLQTIRKISDESVLPLGFGRSISSPGVFQQLLRDGMIDVVRPGLVEFGITGCRRVAALAETYYVAVAPHHEGGPIASAAALHLAASLPNFFIQHIPYSVAEPDRRMRAELGGVGLEQVTDGFASLPKGPGLGITVSESALEKYHAA